MYNSPCNYAVETPFLFSAMQCGKSALDPHYLIAKHKKTFLAVQPTPKIINLSTKKMKLFLWEKLTAEIFVDDNLAMMLVHNLVPLLQTYTYIENVKVGIKSAKIIYWLKKLSVRSNYMARFSINLCENGCVIINMSFIIMSTHIFFLVPSYYS